MKSEKLSKKRHSVKSRAVAKSGFVGAAVFGALVGFIFALTLLLVFCIICLNAQNPDTLISPLALSAGGVSFFAAGFAASKKRSAPLKCGALSGALLCALFFVISRLLGGAPSCGYSLGVGLLIRLAMICLCIFGATVGNNSKGARRKKRRA